MYTSSNTKISNWRIQYNLQRALNVIGGTNVNAKFIFRAHFLFRTIMFLIITSKFVFSNIFINFLPKRFHYIYIKLSKFFLFLEVRNILY